MAKICPKCGNELNDEIQFCGKCGHDFNAKNLCVNCGAELSANDQFCQNCGTEQKVETNEKVQDYLKKGFDSFASTINDMAGEEGKAEIHIVELFSGVFKKHSRDERDDLFACGSRKTTPKEADMVADWPRPWLYSRILIMFAIVFAGLYFMMMYFGNSLAVPGIMFIGALMAPFTALIFFWEMNVPRNISIYEVVSIFFVGGVASLVLTLFLYGVLKIGELDYIGAILVGIAEELGKILVVGFFVKQKNTKYKLNGLLLGACVGAGFAVFETAGYAYLYSQDISSLMHILTLRGVLAIGGHVVWAAISGFGLIVAKGDEPLKFKHFLDTRFIKFLALVVALHAIWDMPINTPYCLIQWGLTGIALIVVLILLNSGLKQVSSIAKRAQNLEKATNTSND